MRITLFFFALLSLQFTLRGQEVIATDGAYSSSSQGSLSWTLGEMITETLPTGSGTFTQGFQQNYEDILGIPHYPQLTNLEIYPNPFSDEVYLAMQDVNDWVQIEVSDVGGRVLLSSQLFFTTGLHTQKITLEGCTPGTYFLRITPHDQVHQLTFPLIKSF